MKINGVKVPSNNAVIINWEFVDVNDCQEGSTNVAVASFVTSYARLHLYGFLEKVISIDNDLLLYFDTDSIIYVEKNGEEVLTTGKFLGELTDELDDYPGARITKFVSGGPKNYGYELQQADGSTKALLKTKGIKIDGETLNVLNFKSMVETIEKFVKEGRTVELRVPQQRFTIDSRDQSITIVEMLKIYRVVSEKRRVLGNDTLPFGYIE